MHCTLTTQAAKSQDIHAEAACSVGSHFASHNPRGAEAGGTPGSLWSQPLQQGHPGPHLGSAHKSEGRGTRKLPGSLCQLSATCTVKTIPWWSEGTSYAPVCALYILPCPWAPLKRAWLCLLHLPFRDLNTWLRFPCPWALSSPRLSSMSALPRFVWHLMCNVEVECVGELSIPPLSNMSIFHHLLSPDTQSSQLSIAWYHSCWLHLHHHQGRGSLWNTAEEQTQSLLGFQWSAHQGEESFECATSTKSCSSNSRAETVLATTSRPASCHAERYGLQKGIHRV